MIVLQGERQEVRSLLFSPDGRALVVPSYLGLQVWKVVAAGGGAPAVLPGWTVSCQFIPDGRLLVSGSGKLFLRDLRTDEVAEFSLGQRAGLARFGLTPDGRSLLLYQSWSSNRLSRRELSDLTAEVWSLRPQRNIDSAPLALAGGERFVLIEGNWSCWLAVTRDARTGRIVSQVETGGHLHNLTLSADRRWLAGQRAARTFVYRADDFAAPPVVIGNDSRREFTGAAFHPSGRFLAATSNDATVKLYDTRSWQMAQAFDWDIGRLRSVAFSPDGMLAAAGGDKGQVVVWDVDL